MAYVTVEDDGGSIELLCFAKALEKYGRLLKEGTPVVVRGKLSVRDEKPPQILCDTVFPLADGAPAPQRESSSVVQPVEGKMLWLRCPSADHPAAAHIRRVFAMFPGPTSARLVYADTGKRLGPPAC